ncbi:DUF2889 domain-containing protein [Roseomonas nepalensis]|uniref:DUF2889 domain-containing protein n=1 Tax=Muricoccus nepalensis TaxID=1854500 RepID=A0A502FVH2_9PROT|nr:DUF2889 domain-containing protein [Roseomonas nepalensis]TPG53431.1 DUF2889 domain-containing protein [Roseomonas nepalensis]
MPLSAPAAREPLHRREISMHGYRRADGLFDIEGHLVDTKTYAFGNLDRGTIEPGEALHGMWLRLTIDDDLVITACEASTDFSPYAICPLAAPNFAALAGVKIGPGFTRAVKEKVGGSLGCTHLREMLAQMATVAFQTVYPVRRKRELEDPAAAQASRNRMIGTCLAYAPDSPIVTERWGKAEPG